MFGNFARKPAIKTHPARAAPHAPGPYAGVGVGEHSGDAAERGKTSSGGKVGSPKGGAGFEVRRRQMPLAWFSLAGGNGIHNRPHLPIASSEVDEKKFCVLPSSPQLATMAGLSKATCVWGLVLASVSFVQSVFGDGLDQQIPLGDLLRNVNAGQPEKANIIFILTDD